MAAVAHGAVAVALDAHPAEQLLAGVETGNHVDEAVPEALEREHEGGGVGEGDGDLARVRDTVESVGARWDPGDQHGAEEEHGDLGVAPGGAVGFDGLVAFEAGILNPGFLFLRLLRALGHGWEGRHAADFVDRRDGRDGDGVLRLAFSAGVASVGCG